MAQTEARSDVDSGAAKILWRMIIPLVALIFLSSLDRVNVSFAALRMNEALEFSQETYGTGVAVFFIGYLLFQTPALIALERFGARWWIAACVVGWGVVAVAMAFIQNAWQFYTLRVLLGVFEAGFAPGVAYCCSQWLPRRYITGAISKTTLAIPISVIVGGPLSTWLMETTNPLGMEGWRFMFMVEGLPTVILGLLAPIWFINSPRDAKWLTPGEREALASELAAERAAMEAKPEAVPLRALLATPKVWISAFCWFSTLIGAYGVIYWLPLVIQEISDANPIEIGFLNAIPWIGVGAGMLIGGWSSDRTQERYLHVAVPAICAGIAMAAAAFAGPNWIALALLTLSGFFFGAAQGAFWGVPTSFLAGGALSVGIAFINTMGSTGGFIGPRVFPILREAGGSYVLPVGAMAALLVLGGLAMLAIRPRAGVAS